MLMYKRRMGSSQFRFSAAFGFNTEQHFMRISTKRQRSDRSGMSEATVSRFKALLCCYTIDTFLLVSKGVKITYTSSSEKVYLAA